MTAKKPGPSDTPCLCNALRRASRVATRLYDKELRGVGLRITQFSLMSLLQRLDEVRQGDLGPLTVLDATSLTRALRPLLDHGWVTVREGKDRRERFVSLTAAGKTKLAKARPAWERAQKLLQCSLPDGAWDSLMGVLSEVSDLSAES